MIKFLKPFHNASNAVEGAVPIDAIVIYASRAITYHRFEIAKPTLCKDPLRCSRMHGAIFETRPVQWRKYLFIDLWFIKLDFRWETKRIDPENYPLPKDFYNDFNAGRKYDA